MPAGTFHALKIESDGDWTAVIGAAASATSASRIDGSGRTVVAHTGRTGVNEVSGRTYKVFWYVPDVKRWVKSEEDYYSANGTRNASYKSELQSSGK